MNGMTPSVRKALADSHVSAVAIVVLCTFSLENLLRGLSELAGPAIFDVGNLLVHFAEKISVVIVLSNFFGAFSAFAAAWFLSHWIFGKGPFRSLKERYAGLRGGKSDA